MAELVDALDSKSLDPIFSLTKCSISIHIEHFSFIISVEIIIFVRALVTFWLLLYSVV